MTAAGRNSIAFPFCVTVARRLFATNARRLDDDNDDGDNDDGKEDDDDNNDNNDGFDDNDDVGDNGCDGNTAYR